jgi:uncharacterized protein YggT (Ycf19 family)
MIVQASLFLIEALTGFLTFALLLRFYMQACRVSFNNQIGTFVVDLTNWLVRPLRKVLPGLYGLDLASLLPAYTCCRSCSPARCSYCVAASPWTRGRPRPCCPCCCGAASWRPCVSASIC